MKLVKSVCGLMPVLGACFAKKTSTDGVFAACTSAAVLGNSAQLVGSHSPRSCSTRVRQSGPYPSASSLTAATHTLLPSLSRSGLASPALSSSLMISKFLSSSTIHGKDPPCTSQ